LRVWDLGFRVRALGLRGYRGRGVKRVQGCRGEEGPGARVGEGVGFRIEGFGCGVYCSGFRIRTRPRSATRHTAPGGGMPSVQGWRLGVRG